MGKQVKKHGYSCKLVRVVDGDTCDALIDLGFDVWIKSRIRFYGVDTWESRTRDLEEKAKGLEAKAYVKDLLENSDDGKFSIISHGRGKYGRVLGEIFVKGHEKSVNELLKENGHAYEYHGEKKKVFGGWHFIIRTEKKSRFTQTKFRSEKMKVSIEYCTSWGYLNQALSLRESIERQFGIKAKLIKGMGGVFEVKFNNSIIFSKKELSRFPNENEVEDLIEYYESVT